MRVVARPFLGASLEDPHPLNLYDISTCSAHDAESTPASHAGQPPCRPPGALPTSRTLLRPPTVVGGPLSCTGAIWVHMSYGQYYLNFRTFVGALIPIWGPMSTPNIALCQNDPGAAFYRVVRTWTRHSRIPAARNPMPQYAPCARSSFNTGLLL